MNYVAVSSTLDRKRMRTSLYYVQRAITQPVLRNMVIHGLRFMVNMATRKGWRHAPPCGKTLADLRNDGMAHLGELLTEAQCADVLRYLKDKRLSRGEAAKDFTLAFPPDNVSLGNYSLDDLVLCPHILALANRPDILGLAADYLGCTPTLSSVSARWSFVHEGGDEVVQKFHRDSEDWRAFRVMVYLTDVAEGAGPHVYVKGTQRDRRRMRLKIHADQDIVDNFSADRIVRQFGKRGTGFAVDTAGLHKGEVPTHVPRLLLSFQYSILPCFLYDWEPVDVEHHRYDSYVNRLILRTRRQPKERAGPSASLAAGTRSR